MRNKETKSCCAGLFLCVNHAVPALLEISADLSERFIHAENKAHVATAIIVEINSLQYTDSGNPIEYEFKVSIIDVIESQLSAHPEEERRLQK